MMLPIGIKQITILQKNFKSNTNIEDLESQICNSQKATEAKKLNSQFYVTKPCARVTKPCDLTT